MDVEDAAFAFIRFENEAVVQLKTPWAGNLTDEIPQGDVFGRELNNCTIYGSKATVRLRPLTLFQDRDASSWTKRSPPADDADSFELQMRNFLDAVAGCSAPMNNAEQAVYLMEMRDAIYLRAVSAVRCRSRGEENSHQKPSAEAFRVESKLSVQYQHYEKTISSPSCHPGLRTRLLVLHDRGERTQRHDHHAH